MPKATQPKRDTSDIQAHTGLQSPFRHGTPGVATLRLDLKELAILGTRAIPGELSLWCQPTQEYLSKSSPLILEAKLVYLWGPRQRRSCCLHPNLEPAYHSRSQDAGLGATHLPHSHCPGSCHGDCWNSRSHCRMEVPKRRKVAREGQGTAGSSWPG